jgi:hypothetical protein
LTFVSDTSPKANARYFELLRQAGPERRLAICLGLSRATRELAIAGIKQAHPDRLLSDDELRQKLNQEQRSLIGAGGEHVAQADETVTRHG